jgi:hypothetical protein
MNDIDGLKARVLFYQNTNDHNRYVATTYEHTLLCILDMLHRPDSIAALKDEIVSEIESALQERPIYQNRFSQSKEL